MTDTDREHAEHAEREQRIRELVDQAPPLSPEQILRLQALFVVDPPPDR